MDDDVRDIFEVEKLLTDSAPQPLTKDAILHPQKDDRRPKKEALYPALPKRATGMKRELFALLSSEAGSDASSILPTDTGMGYRQPKARLGRSKVRRWKWVPFQNPARTDGLVLNHWRREADDKREYPYARFNKSMSVPAYSEEEYKKHLNEEDWTKEETDHLFELCQQFDLRFPVVCDRYNSWAVKRRSVEDLKERYYSVCNRLSKSRTRDVDSVESELVAYDADHERRRKSQLERLYNRTPEQVEEEEMLIAELKKIELRKKEREKKQQDLQKLISAAEQTAEASRKPLKKVTSSKLKKTAPQPSRQIPEGNPGVFKSYDKSSGVTLRGNKMKMPVTIGQKKAKLIEQLLDEMGVVLHPIPTENVCVQFNELRNDILLLLDLKAGCDACDFEYQALKHRYEALPPDKRSRVLLPEISASPRKQQVSASLPVMEAVTPTARKRRMAGLESPFKKKKA